jgi:hypothetical protein
MCEPRSQWQGRFRRHGIIPSSWSAMTALADFDLASCLMAECELVSCRLPDGKRRNPSSRLFILDFEPFRIVCSIMCR